MDLYNSWNDIILQEERKSSHTGKRGSGPTRAQCGEKGEVRRMEEPQKGLHEQVQGPRTDSVCLGSYKQLSASGIWGEG